MTMEGVHLYELPNTLARALLQIRHKHWTLNIDFVAFMFKSTILYFE